MQIEFNYHGGARKNSGRKRLHSKGVSHRQREKVTRHTPLHINFKFKTQIKNKFCLRILKRAIVNSSRFGLRVIHFSLQHNHIHLIIEADSNEILTAGMRSLTITFAKGLERGRVQIERYHLHVLKSIRETKNAITYVLFNKQKHDKGTYSTIDEYCSIFSVDNALKMISEYAKKNKILLNVQRSFWKGDQIISYVLKRSLSELTA